MHEHINTEIEKKFIIENPGINKLRTESLGNEADIIQTYLVSEGDFTSCRVREIRCRGITSYTHTRKKNIDEMTRAEDEKTITREEYEKLLKNMDISRKPIRKKRFAVKYKGKCFEIDLYPFDTEKAILEVELEDKNEFFEIPSFIKVITDVTADRRFSNKSLAKMLKNCEISDTEAHFPKRFGQSR